mmetsp:Transcript_32237/g.49854  ORF Transcript_32237/g.49854 Transcript_32237/m.49854 type:complete len:379 (-) Transcript_32237:184-1320(-)
MDAADGNPPRGVPSSNPKRPATSLRPNPYAKPKRCSLVPPSAPPATGAKSNNYSARGSAGVSVPGPTSTVTSSRISGDDPFGLPTALRPDTFSQAFGDQAASTGNETTPHHVTESASSRPSSSLFATSRSVTDAVSAKDNHSFIPTDTHTLYVSTRQRGNKILEHLRNVPWDYATMVPDYLMAYDKCALFLSLKYHRLKGVEYIRERIRELKGSFKLRVLLVLVDVDDSEAQLSNLSRSCVQDDMSLLLAFSEEEAARYLEALKSLQGRDASAIQRREKDTFLDRAADALGAVRSVNKTDAAQLLAQFGSLRGAATARADELALCPGIGEKKVRRLEEAFHRPFRGRAKRTAMEGQRSAGSDARSGVGAGEGREKESG